MESNSDRDCTQKLDFTILSAAFSPKSVLQPDRAIATNSEIENYNKSRKVSHCENLTDATNRNLVLLKDRYLLSNINEDRNNNPEYMCMDIATEEKYLCKVISEPYDKVQRAYFDCATTNDRKIRTVEDIVPAAQDRTYILLRTPDFGNLHTYIRDSRRLRESEAKVMFRQICKTVEICHHNGIVLRDLKLRKFFFTDRDRKNLQYESLEGAVILNDANDDKLSDKIGCPLYVAPELITTNSNYGGKAADIWALGVILYTMLIGKYPFNDMDGQNLFTKIITCNPYIPAGLSSKAKCLLRSLLRRQPEERLTIEDIFFHPWFNGNEMNSRDFQSSNETEDGDHCVPDLAFENNSFELT